MTDVPATPKASYDACSQPGDFYIVENETDARLSFLCPCGCGMLCGIKIRGPGAWQWDGNREKPTATPSININNEHWHGYLTDGVFKSC